MLSSGKEFDEKFLDSKYVLKMYFKPSRKNENFVFLPDPILPVWLKILHLIELIIFKKMATLCAVNDRKYVFHFRPKPKPKLEKYLALGQIPKPKPKVQIYVKIGGILLKFNVSND